MYSNQGRPGYEKGHCPQNHIVRATLTEDQSKTTLVNCETCGAYILPVWDEVIDPTARYRHPEGKYTVGVDTALGYDFGGLLTYETLVVTEEAYKEQMEHQKKQREFALRRIGLGPKK